MTPATIAILAILCAGVLWAPRRFALLALMTSMIYLSQRNGLDIGGFRMHPGRFLELAGAVRVIGRREFQWRDLNRLDRAVLIAYGYVTLMVLLRAAFGYGTSADIKMATPTSKLGELIDVLLTYVVFRGLIKTPSDIRLLLIRTVPLLLPFVGLLWIERTTGANPLAALGAIPRVWIDADGGRVRCMGSFLHPALLGTFGAGLAAMYIAISGVKSCRRWGMLGLAASVAIVLMANSGGPLTMLTGVLIGWGCWFIRGHMKLFRIGVFGALLGLALVMRDPIWYLPSKMSLLFGGSGWHRSYLMQQAITNFDKWWLAGMPLDQTLHWFPYLVLGAADITNLYVAFGVDGGLIAMLLLIRLLKTAFSEAGRTVQKFDACRPSRSEEALLMWGLGVAIAGHMANFFSITYFDQTSSFWLLQLAAISSISASVATRTAVGADVMREATQDPYRMVSMGRRAKGGAARARWAASRNALRRQWRL